MSGTTELELDLSEADLTTLIELSISGLSESAQDIYVSHIKDGTHFQAAYGWSILQHHQSNSDPTDQLLSSVAVIQMHIKSLTTASQEVYASDIDNGIHFLMAVGHAAINEQVISSITLALETQDEKRSNGDMG